MLFSSCENIAAFVSVANEASMTVFSRAEDQEAHQSELFKSYKQFHPSSSDTVIFLATIRFPLWCLFHLHPIRLARPRFSTINLGNPLEHFTTHQPRTNIDVRSFGHANVTAGAPISLILSTFVCPVQACSNPSLFRGRY